MSSDSRQILSLLDRMLQSERWPQQQQQQLQTKFLGPLLEHAAHNVPFYADRLSFLRNQLDKCVPGSEQWLMIPLLSREQLLREADLIQCQQMEKKYPSAFKTSTSGSTGHTRCRNRNQLRRRQFQV